MCYHYARLGSILPGRPSRRYKDEAEAKGDIDLTLKAVNNTLRKLGWASESEPLGLR
jgi:hypothetical protein